jgi:hypothetical protein
LSEIWAPKLLARGLDTLELGASGNVTFTAEDARALSVGVAETAAAGGGVMDRVDMVFPDGGFRMSAAEQPVLSLDSGSPDVAPTGDELNITATRAVALSASTSAEPPRRVDLAGSVVNLSTVGDIVVSSDGNPTMTVQKDRVVVRATWSSPAPSSCHINAWRRYG